MCVRGNRKDAARTLKIASRTLLLSLVHTEFSEFLLFPKATYWKDKPVFNHKFDQLLSLFLVIFSICPLH